LTGRIGSTATPSQFAYESPAANVDKKHTRSLTLSTGAVVEETPVVAVRAE
jgi:hypothetical protein